MQLSRKSLACICLAIAISLAAQTNVKAQESRTWKNTTGKFSVEAVLTEQNATSVELKTTDGRTITVPKSQLSRSDLAHLKSLVDVKGTPSAQTVETRLTSKLNGPPVAVEAGETLPAFLARLEIPTFIDERSLEEVGLTPDLALDPIPGAETLGAQLDAMLMTYQLTWYRVRSVLVIATEETAERHAMETLAYRIPVPRDDYSAVIKKIEAVEPKSWESLGGPGSVAPFPQAIVIHQSAGVHRALARKLGISAIPKSYVHPLDSKILSVELSNNSIQEFAKQIQAQTGRQAKVADSMANQKNLTAKLTNVTAVDAMELVLGQVGGQWLETPNGLEFVSVQEAENRVAKQVVSVPFASPQLSRMIVNVTATLVEPDSWEFLGGNGKMKYVSGKRFEVTQSQPNFRKLNQFFQYLSGAR